MLKLQCTNFILILPMNFIFYLNIWPKDTGSLKLASVIFSVALKHSKTHTNVLLAWILSLLTILITGRRNEGHMYMLDCQWEPFDMIIMQFTFITRSFSSNWNWSSIRYNRKTETFSVFQPSCVDTNLKLNLVNFFPFFSSSFRGEDLCRLVHITPGYKIEVALE